MALEKAVLLEDQEPGVDDAVAVGGRQVRGWGPSHRPFAPSHRPSRRKKEWLDTPSETGDGFGEIIEIIMGKKGSGSRELESLIVPRFTI